MASRSPPEAVVLLSDSEVNSSDDELLYDLIDQSDHLVTKFEDKRGPKTNEVSSLKQQLQEKNKAIEQLEMQLEGIRIASEEELKANQAKHQCVEKQEASEKKKQNEGTRAGNNESEGTALKADEESNTKLALFLAAFFLNYILSIVLDIIRPKETFSPEEKLYSILKTCFVVLSVISHFCAAYFGMRRLRIRMAFVFVVAQIGNMVVFNFDYFFLVMKILTTAVSMYCMGDDAVDDFFIAFMGLKFFCDTDGLREHTILTFDRKIDGNDKLGFEYYHTNSGLNIVKVTQNGEEKGMRRGDKIVKINGVKMNDLSINFVDTLIKNLEGTVTYEVKRKAAE